MAENTITVNGVSLDAPLDELLDAARASFQVAFEPFTVDGLTLDILQISDMAAYVDKLAELSPDKAIELPFWAKVWPSSLVLGYYLKRMPARGDERVLEVGAGVGICGLVAAARGLDCVLSDIEPEALLFAQINILQNGLQDTARVRRVDFANDRLEERFDRIVGCEVLYRDEHARPLTRFILHHLQPSPDAEAVISMAYKRKAKKFFQVAEKEFLFQEKVIGFKPPEGGDKDADDRHLSRILRLKPRKQSTPQGAASR
jgi:predicted nicotinamide N-methyase